MQFTKAQQTLILSARISQVSALINDVFNFSTSTLARERCVYFSSPLTKATQCST